MAQFRVGMIGCGRPWRMEGAKGTGIGNVHANGYTASPDCEIVAAADLDQSNLDSFCRTHHIANGYQSHKEMLEKENLDIVGVTLGPSLHAQLVIDAARAGVKAVHCEKPMAMTWGDARKMAAVCEENGVQLTFNHQRRYSAPYAKAKELLDAGAIGKLTRVDACCPDLLHWGTHWFDIMMFYNHDEPAAWVMGQMEARGGYGGREAAEGQGVSYFLWKNGVYGLMMGQKPPYEFANRLIGTEGMIEVPWLFTDQGEIRMMNKESKGEWQSIDCWWNDKNYSPEIFATAALLDKTIPGHFWTQHYAWTGSIAAGIFDLVDALKNGREPEMSVRKSLQATELVFATMESSRRRGRVDLPLEIEDNPFMSMLEAGDISLEG
ncbi:MAG: Gfo/Idh/MocA family oxidoreductase [Chloroflexi bacterium]|nr:Gfo/Idh/MocA family oxidoreductase [Chloroflexota bacterium]